MINNTLVLPDGQRIKDWVPSGSIGIVPGSFNPLHAAHLFIFEKALERSGNAVFEISTHITDKGLVTEHDLENRLRQFAWKYPVVITDAPRFADKISALGLDGVNNNAYFYIGADTYQRLYRDNANDIETYPASFAVFDRIQYNTLIVLDKNGPNPRNVVWGGEQPQHLNELSSTRLRRLQD